MTSLKYISPSLQDVYSRKYVTHHGTRLKTVYVIHMADMFLNRYVIFNKDTMKMNSRILKWMYGSSYPRYVDYLVDMGFIVLWKNYSVGLKSKAYKLTDSAKSCVLSVSIEIPERLARKAAKMNTSIDVIDERVKVKLVSDLYRIDIDARGAREWIDENVDRTDKAYAVNMNSCAKIANRDIYYSFDKFGRFHTNYTSLKKEIRSKFLSIDGMPVSEIDITNSQPFFLYILMRENGFTKFDGFDVDVLSGQIYERIRDLSGLTRKEVKPKVYSVLFGRNSTNDSWNTMFKSMYPDVYAWIVDFKYKHKSYKVIAQELQRIESDFIFNNLIPKLMDVMDVPIVTIHDSIIVPAASYDDVSRIFSSTKLDLIDNKLKLKILSGAVGNIV